MEENPRKLGSNVDFLKKNRPHFVPVKQEERVRITPDTLDFLGSNRSFAYFYSVTLLREFSPKGYNFRVASVRVTRRKSDGQRL